MSNAFDRTVNELREKGMNPEEILLEISESQELSKIFPVSEVFNTKCNSEEFYKAKIKMLLAKIGMPSRLCGYECWVTAILIYKNSSVKRLHMSRDVYPQVGRILGNKPKTVEGVMRVAVERMFERCSIETLEDVFGDNYDIQKGKLTNKEFLAFMVTRI